MLGPYPAFAFRQTRNAPLQITFVATSAQLDSWAKVPTKMSTRPNGFQRPEIRRHVQEVSEFFQDKLNCSPTAVIIGVEPDMMSCVHILQPDGQTAIDETSVETTPVPCLVTIDFEPWSSAKYANALDTEIRALFESVSHLYAIDPSTEATSDSDDSTEDGEEEPIDEGFEEAPQDDSTEPSDDQQGEADPEADDEQEEDAEDLNPLTSLRPGELADSITKGSFVGWSEKDRLHLRDQLKDDRKPGLIIDGQHRIKGTARSGLVPFIVSLLPRSNWAELAFQFIVNNQSAKKVDEGLLISIVGSSLSPAEVTETEGRLYRAGIKVSLIQAVMRVQAEENPFSGMLKFGIPRETGFLEAPAMQKKVVQTWYGSRGRTGQAYKFGRVQAADAKPWSMAEVFGNVSDAASARERAHEWQDKYWFSYFKAFWTPIQEHFSKDGTLWPENESQWPDQGASPEVDRTRMKLMRVTVLGLLQASLLQAWRRQIEDQWESQTGKTNLEGYRPEPEDVQRGIAMLVRRIPADFFIGLSYRGFDASRDLREDFQLQLLALLEKKKEWADIRSTHRFWK